MNAITAIFMTVLQRLGVLIIQVVTCVPAKVSMTTDLHNCSNDQESFVKVSAFKISLTSFTL